MWSGDHYNRADPHFPVSSVRKDARQVNDLAGELKAMMIGKKSTDGDLKGFKDDLDARGNVAGIYCAVRQSAG